MLRRRRSGGNWQAGFGERHVDVCFLGLQYWALEMTNGYADVQVCWRVLHSGAAATCQLDGVIGIQLAAL